MDALEFFQKSEGQWRSLRTTHHLAFRRAEGGGSSIRVKTLTAEDPKIQEICDIHQYDPQTAVGGAYVSWNGEMDWDKEDENHQGETVFSLIPQADNPQKGKLLRERGYAEVVPIAGDYEIDDHGALLLNTTYESMNTIERFWFPGHHLRMRTSTVTRFGGFSTATFCVEMREDFQHHDPVTPSAIAQEFSQGAISGW